MEEQDIWNRLAENLEEYWEILVLSIPKIAISLLILCTFIFLAIFIGKVFKRKMQGRATDNITIAFVIRLARTVMVVMGIILAFHALGFRGIAGGMLAGAGVGAIILGFAFKEIGENFLAGIILVFDRPFNIGDTVKINENLGIVIGLKFRVTHVKSFDGRDIYVPNAAVIRNDVINYTRDGLFQHRFLIGIDYNDDIESCRNLIIDTVNKHPKTILAERTQVFIEDFGTNSVNLNVLFWIDTQDYQKEAYLVKAEVMRDVKNELVRNGFSFPANVVELKTYKDQPLAILGSSSEGSPSNI